MLFYRQQTKDTHMSVLVQFVVGQFDFLKGNHLLHQLLSGEGGVRVNVQPAGRGQERDHEEEEVERRVTSCALIGLAAFETSVRNQRSTA